MIAPMDMKELKDFVRRYFPLGTIDDDGFEISIRTGLTEDRATKILIPADDDQSGVVPERKPEFGRYRGD